MTKLSHSSIALEKSTVLEVPRLCWCNSGCLFVCPRGGPAWAGRRHGADRPSADTLKIHGLRHSSRDQRIQHPTPVRITLTARQPECNRREQRKDQIKTQAIRLLFNADHSSVTLFSVFARCYCIPGPSVGGQCWVVVTGVASSRWEFSCGSNSSGSSRSDISDCCTCICSLGVVLEVAF